jgi:PIN domain nuclease of toxin-antitoxin system
LEVSAAFGPAGFVSLPIVGEHAARVSRLPPIHRDPFDRMLVAQALTEPLRLVTDDAALGLYGEIVTVV